MASHYIVKKLDIGIGSTAHWCTQEPEFLVVFIHGFAGAAESTWHRFSGLIRERAEFANADVVFLGYNSTRARAIASARLLLPFILRVIEAPHEVANSSIAWYGKPRSPFRYRRILLVGHSLGGALIRQIALDLFETDPGNTLPIRVLLFAPAHKGSNALTLADEAFRQGTFSLFRTLSSLVRFRRSVLQDLSLGSRFLTDLENQTRQRIGGGHGGRLIASLVCFGEFDNIVELADFASDPPFQVVANRNHTDVCKPVPGYSDPVDHVARYL